MRNLHDPRIDWFRHGGRFYIVVDPHGATLYLDEPRYLRNSRAWDSNELSWELLAVPSDRQPQDGSAPSSGPVTGNGSTASQGETPTSDIDTKRKASPPVPRWKNWASKLVSSYRKWKNTPAGGYNLPPEGSTGSRKTPSSRLKFQGNLVLPTNGNIGRLVTDWINILSGFTGKTTLSSRNPSSAVSRHLSVLSKSNGTLYVVKYLKVSYIVVLKYLSGEKLTKTDQLGLHVGLRNGLPTWLPHLWRHWVRSHDIHGIRFVLSFLYIYKSIEVEVEPDLSTIESTPWKGDSSDFRQFCHSILKSYKVPVATLKDIQPIGYQSMAAGVNTPVISAGIRTDAVAWYLRDREAPTPLNEWIGVLQSALEGDNHFINLLEGMYASAEHHQVQGMGKLGKLSTFSDGGGKQRIVALPDWWTQLLLKPVHDHLMKVLSLFPQDATFDQDGKLKEFADRGYKAVHSIDLKAATDMIPQQLYVDVLGFIFGEQLAKLWVRLLVDRDYHFKHGKNSERTLRYTRGQPMGALSSWPAMALVHHMVVLYSASLAGRNAVTFRDYLVLGDDNVTADPDVASMYLKVAERLGIVISLPKTFTSVQTGLFQFASQVYFEGVNISPTSLKQEVNCVRPIDRLSQCWSILKRWYPTEGVAKLLRLMVPRSLWPEISQSIMGGESHPLIQLIVRTLLIPGTESSVLGGCSEAAIRSFLSSYTGRFNLDRVITFSKKAEEALGDLCSTEVAILQHIIFSIADDCHTVLEGFKSGLAGVSQGTPDEKVIKGDYYYASLPSYQRRVTKLLSWYFPYISRIRHAATFGDPAKLPRLLNDMLDVVPLVRSLSNFSDDLMTRNQSAVVLAQALSRYNLEPGLVPGSLFRQLTSFGVQVERLARAAHGGRRPGVLKHKVHRRKPRVLVKTQTK